MIRYLLASLRADNRGAAVIEMAMVAPVLALCVIGIVDISNAFSKQLSLEQGAQRSFDKDTATTENASVESTLASEVQSQVNGSTTSGGVTTCN
ncbi:MAG: pilus assembly protein, partial [Sphingomonas sp.]|nr:pilus assembly protein [Sphingomonas sp.]